ncbi:MAG: BACON domain-containing protein [Bacteroidetes bacterium]|uniref:BACON domain-containing protein n=1 Tax=Candidatus Merdivivens pullistercoris TaxID=2840873 RepID=A0A9D9N8I1_9BACT|nr:BACON domain-containing protein [Candidatus Merdivivens pullistercoris]
MKKRFAIIALGACSVLLSIYGCEQESVIEKEDPVLSAAPASLEVPVEGGEFLVSVECNLESWEMGTEQEWITLEKLNDMTIKLTVSENPAEQPYRTGTVNIMSPEVEGLSSSIIISQQEGYTLEGDWKALAIYDKSSNSDTWDLANDYVSLGIDAHYIMDLQENKLTMTVNMENVEPLEQIFDIVSYEPGGSFTVSSEEEEAQYDISLLDSDNLEFIGYSSFLDTYSKIVCVRADAQ